MPLTEDDIRKREFVENLLQLSKEDALAFFSDKNQFRWVICPACGGSHHQPQFVKDGFQYVLCDGCATLFVNPQPSPEQLNNCSLKGASAKFFIEKFLPSVGEMRRKTIFQPRAQALMSLIKGNHLHCIGDIGAGLGIFCEELRSLFPDKKIIVIESEHTLAEVCRYKGLSVIEKSLHEVNPDDIQFDLLTTFELIEHLTAPSEFLTKARTLLRPGGYILFTTLNNEGFDFRVLWENSKNIYPPHHITFLNPRSATMLLERCGLECVEITTPGKLDVDIVDKRRKEGMITMDRFIRLFLERSSQKNKEVFQEMLIEHSLSSHMWVLARRPPAAL